MSKTYEEILQSLKDAFTETASAWGDLAGYLKTPQTKSITLQDWNTLIALLGRTDSYIRALYPLISGLGELGERLKEDVSDIATDVENTAASIEDATLESASVSDEGTLSFTRRDGNVLTVSGNVIGPVGPTGPEGKQGSPGPRGSSGASVSNVYSDEEGNLYFELDNGVRLGPIDPKFDQMSTFNIGVNSAALTQGSAAFGRNSRAGSKAYYIAAIYRNGTADSSGIYTGKIALTDKVPETRFVNVSSETLDSFIEPTLMCDYAVGDEFCVVNNTHYAFCGRITNVNQNIIWYETALTAYDYDLNPSTLVLPNDNFAISNDGGKRDNWRDCVFWVPSKPDRGVTITNGLEGEELDTMFNTAYAFGDYAFATADDAFAAGDTVFVGGNHGFVFGVLNRGAYGNLVGMRDNISTGVHSALLGRGLINLGSYNALFNERNTGLGRDLILGGCDNVDSGSRNVGTGNKNKNSGNGNVYGGTSNVIDTSSATVNGSNSIERGSNSLLNGYSCVTSTATDPGVSARANTDLKYVTYPSTLPAPGSAVDCTLNIGNSNLVRHKQCGAIGRHLITGRNFQLVGGVSNAIDSGAMFVLGNGAENGRTVKNCFTVGANGTRTSVATDAVTVAYLEARLIEGTW